MVARFIGAVLDAEESSERAGDGVGDEQLSPLGSQLREQLSDPRAGRSLGPAVERTMVRGFASMVALNTAEIALCGPRALAEPREKPPDAVWAAWVRSLGSAWYDTATVLRRAAAEELERADWSWRGNVGRMTLVLMGSGANDLLAGFQELGVASPGLLDPRRYLHRSRSGRDSAPMSYLCLFVGAGRALYHALTKRADREFTVAWSGG